MFLPDRCCHVYVMPKPDRFSRTISILITSFDTTNVGSPFQIPYLERGEKLGAELLGLAPFAFLLTTLYNQSQ